MKKIKMVILLCFLALAYQSQLVAELVFEIEAPGEVGTKGASDDSSTDQDDVKHKSTYDVISFKNKDRINGKLLSLDPAQGISWKSPESVKDILFSTINVDKIVFAKKKQDKTNVNSSIVLTNNDILGGELISYNSKTVSLKTAYGSLFEIDKNMVKAIYPGSENSSIIYSGPNTVEEWTKSSRHNNGSFSVVDETLVIDGYCGAGMDAKLPDMASIDFYYEVSGNSQLRVIFFASKLENPKNCYSMSISSGYIYLQRNSGGNLGNVQCKALRSGKGRITILVDKKDKKITLLVNNAMVKQWTDTEEIGDGTFISFMNQSQGSIKIKNIEISKWNGSLPGAKDKKENEDKDLIVFVNGDKVSGTLLSIEKGQTVFKTEYAELKIPIKRIKKISTAIKGQHIARKNSEDAQFIFYNGNAITLKLLKISDGEVIGESENFGEKSLKLDVFKTMNLNIY